MIYKKATDDLISELPTRPNICTVHTICDPLNLLFKYLRISFIK